MTAPPWRVRLHERAADGVTVVDDPAAATPARARDALRTLAVLSRGKQRRTWAVLGELAGGDPDAHMDLGRFVVRLDVTRLVVVGAAAGGIHAGAVLEGSWGEESVHLDDAAAAAGLLRAQVAPGDVVLVLGAELEPVSAGLTAAAERAR